MKKSERKSEHESPEDEHEPHFRLINFEFPIGGTLPSEHHILTLSNHKETIRGEKHFPIKVQAPSEAPHVQPIKNESLIHTQDEEGLRAREAEATHPPNEDEAPFRRIQFFPSLITRKWVGQVPTLLIGN